MFGSRTNSGVSLVNWPTISYLWNTKVVELVMDKSASSETLASCTGVKTIHAKTKQSVTYKVKKDGKVMLCGGSQSPRLLLKTKEIADTNDRIGKRVNDHICSKFCILLKVFEHQLFVTLT